MAVVPGHVTVIPADVGAYGEVIGPVDYGCVRRHRHRRLATYLWLHGFRETLQGLVDETDAFMSAAHLSGLVRQGLWDDAIAYLSRFLPPSSHPRSDEAQVLIHFLKHHKAFASMVAGPGGDNRDLWYFNSKYNTGYLKHDGSVSHDDLRMRSIVLSLLNSQQIRSSLDWERVRHKASRIVHDLIFKAPELRDLSLFPGGSMMSHDVLPIGFRSRRRRHVKEQRLPRPKTLTKIFLRTKKRLPSSTRSHQLNNGLTDKTKKWVVDILDESLQAGSLKLQSSGKKGVPSATAMSNTLTDLSKNSVSGTSSLANSGAPVAAVSQAVKLTSYGENTGIFAVINRGTSKLLSLENSNLGKHLRTEEVLFEQGPHKKVQRTSGAFGEACSWPQ